MTPVYLMRAHRLTFRSMRAVICLIVLAASVAGCGYKGPLYLPKDKPGAQKPAAQKPAPPDAKPQEETKPAPE